MQTEEDQERGHAGEGNGGGAAVFESLGLNPRLFVNDVLNAVDDLTDTAFDLFLGKAPEIIGSVEGEKAQALDKGIKSVQKSVNAAKAEGFGCWEVLCLKLLFGVPQGFSLSDNNGCSESSSIEVLELSDVELDSELDSLRKKLAAAGKEHEELHNKISLLETGSNYHTKFDASIADTLSLFEDDSVQKSFRDILKALPELHQKLYDTRTKSSANVHYLLSSDSYDGTVPAPDEGFSGRLEDIKDAISILRAREAY